jgi:hypothetical protein
VPFQSYETRVQSFYFYLTIVGLCSPPKTEKS